jgi:hypothetical protein
MIEKRRLTSRDVPGILATLAGDDEEAQCEVLTRLCPCRNRRYDREVWLEILRAYSCGGSGTVRDQAGHALDTLRQRLRTDPRSQELVRWLAEQDALPFPLDDEIPEWQPRAVPGQAGGPLRIPRPERTPRSRANRRR